MVRSVSRIFSTDCKAAGGICTLGGAALVVASLVLTLFLVATVGRDLPLHVGHQLVAPPPHQPDQRHHGHICGDRQQHSIRTT
jgi:hypothetical protein